MYGVKVELYKVLPEVPTPVYGTSMSACFDLSFQPCQRFSIQGFDVWNRPCDRMTYNDTVDILPGDRILVPTGLIMKIKSGPGIETFPQLANYSIRLHARSGMSLKHGLVLANAEGVVDADYQQEIFVMLTNISAVPATIKKGDRIAQAEVVKNFRVYFELVESHPTPHSERDGGFGSTGHA